MMNSYMKMAVESAREGIQKNEGGPFGACIVLHEKILAVTHNTVLAEKDPTCHAEMNAIRAACKILGQFDLSGCEIFSTAEPCPMCLAAIYWARISKIHIGVRRHVAHEYGFDDDRFYQDLKLSMEQRPIPASIGVLQEECHELFEEWKKLGRPLY